MSICRGEACLVRRVLKSMRGNGEKMTKLRLQVRRIKRFSELPCQVSALEPKVQGGSQFVTVGFSVRAEPAQKQQ
jgi:hypothetical protein